MKTRIVNLSLNEERRMLFLADIHGNYKLFDKLLKKLNFNQNDYLFVLGDMIEKSDANLAKNLLGAMPTEAISPVSDKIVSFNFIP